MVWKFVGLTCRCYKQPTVNNAEVPENMVQELVGVCRACFPDSSSRHSSAVQRDLRESFVQHLNPQAETFPKTLGDLTDRLKCWRNMLSGYLDEHMPTRLQLYAESPTLQEMSLTGIEMPGQHMKGEEIIPEATVFLEKIGSGVAIIRRQGAALRRLALYGSDGHVQHFILQTGVNSIMNIPNP